MVTFFCFVFRSRLWSVPYPASIGAGITLPIPNGRFRLGFDGTNRMLALTWGAFW